MTLGRDNRRRLCFGHFWSNNLYIDIIHLGRDSRRRLYMVTFDPIIYTLILYT